MRNDYDEGIMMPWGEIVTRRCVITLEDGSKVRATLAMRKPKGAVFPGELERRAVEAFNRSQPGMRNKVVGIHVMRN